jgi:hypothetical protein
MMFGTTQPESSNNKWRSQLDRFVKSNQKELAALSWALWQENGDSQGTIGIDIQPTPHFIYCPQEALQKLNDKVENRLQEMLGLIKHFKPEVEVLMVGVGDGEVKLIYFEPTIAPPLCFQQLGLDIDALMDLLEENMGKEINV